MDSTLLAIFLLIFGLAAGAAGGWFLGSRPVADWRARFEEKDGEAKKYADDVKRMTPELATMSERAARADGLANELDKARAQNAQFRACLLYTSDAADE